jgi:hypothetical protein
MTAKHTQTHARRYEGVAVFGVEDSGAVGSHVSRAAISDGLDSRNTQVSLPCTHSFNVRLPVGGGGVVLLLCAPARPLSCDK